MKTLKSCTHSLRLYRSDADPEQVYFPGAGCGISKYSVIIGLRVKFLVAHHPARATESTDVREEVEMIQRNLERLHASHRKPCHRPVIAVGNGSVGLINERN